MKAIAAMSLNRVVGCDNMIPWHIPEDFRWFKQATLGHTVAMGRRTFESLGSRPLPGRINFVLTKHPREFIKTLESSDLPERLGIKAFRFGRGALTSELTKSFVLHGPPGTEVRVISDFELLRTYDLAASTWLCGGASIYRQFLGRCTDLYLSVVLREVEGDAFFPPFEDGFELIDVPLRHAEFEVRHYRNLHA
jgi:dihydrofolate reductase